MQPPDPRPPFIAAFASSRRSALEARWIFHQATRMHRSGVGQTPPALAERTVVVFMHSLHRQGVYEKKRQLDSDGRVARSFDRFSVHFTTTAELDRGSGFFSTPGKPTGYSWRRLSGNHDKERWGVFLEHFGGKKKKCSAICWMARIWPPPGLTERILAWSAHLPDGGHSLKQYTSTLKSPSQSTSALHMKRILWKRPGPSWSKRRDLIRRRLLVLKDSFKFEAWRGPARNERMLKQILFSFWSRQERVYKVETFFFAICTAG